MNIKKKIKEYKNKFKNKETIKFVDFLEVLLDWLDFLIEKKRISKEEEKILSEYFPKKIFYELDKVSSTEPILEYENLKELLLDETADFLVGITKTGNVRMVDFDSVQFNLYGIFGKEKIASMVEHTRIKLEESIKKQREEKLKEEKKKKDTEVAWLKKINEMPEKELVKLITRTLFEFTPSARTHEERLEAIKKNQEAILIQKNKFHNFEQKIIDATEDAKADAETNVNRQVGRVKMKVEKVSGEFIEKAKEFVSDEGPKKMINEAKERILDGKEKLSVALKDKGKMWERDFGVKIEGAKERITGKTVNLSELGEKRRASISKRAKSELAKAGNMIKSETVQFQSDVDIAKEKFSGKAEQVSEKGMKELGKARGMILKEKSEFVADVDTVKAVFGRKGKEIDEARSDFKGKSEKAAESFILRGDDIESEMYGTILEGKNKFEENREEAKKRFSVKAIEITRKASKHISEKKEKFISGRDSARKRFLVKSEGIKGNEFEPVTLSESNDKSYFTSGTNVAKGKIKKANVTLLNKAKNNRLKMVEEMQRRRELFLYDVRFAQDSIHKHAVQFAEKIAEKREEFETTQEKIIAKHKAKQKAHMIQTLLRTIRSMH
jgi:hypothetical protein